LDSIKGSKNSLTVTCNAWYALLEEAAQNRLSFNGGLRPGK